MRFVGIVLRLLLCLFAMRKRLAAFTGDSSGSQAASADGAARGGVRRRLAGADMATQAKAQAGINVQQKPLNKLLMKKWCKGKFTCRDVFEVGSAASSQGCPDLERLAQTDLHNASRNLTAAIGFPKKAPRISIIPVQSKRGPRELPIICPIDALEKMISDDADRFCKSMKAGRAGFEMVKGRGQAKRNMRKTGLERVLPTIYVHVHRLTDICVHIDICVFVHNYIYKHIHIYIYIYMYIIYNYTKLPTSRK